MNRETDRRKKNQYFEARADVRAFVGRKVFLLYHLFPSKVYPCAARCQHKCSSATYLWWSAWPRYNNITKCHFCDFCGLQGTNKTQSDASCVWRAGMSDYQSRYRRRNGLLPGFVLPSLPQGQVPLRLILPITDSELADPIWLCQLSQHKYVMSESGMSK